MTEAHRSSDDLVLLQTLRCIGHSSADRVATASGLGDDAGPLLARHQERGLASLDEGPFGGWSLTALGRAHVETLVEDELESSGARADVLDSYRMFLPLNALVMDVVHDWQLRSFANTRAMNDHSDPLYDDEVLTRLASINDRAQDLLSGITGRISRFSSYGPRLSSALARARAGQISSVADDLESYHNIWFQLHEDLLVTCGISRDDERRGL